jgi:hypothetical protein
LGKRTSIERFFGRVLIFRLQRPSVFGWSAVDTRVALTYAAVWVIALAAWQAGRPELIRSPRLVLAHVWEGVECSSALSARERRNEPNWAAQMPVYGALSSQNAPDSTY